MTFSTCPEDKRSRDGPAGEKKPEDGWDTHRIIRGTAIGRGAAGFGFRPGPGPVFVQAGAVNRACLASGEGAGVLGMGLGLGSGGRDGREGEGKSNDETHGDDFGRQLVGSRPDMVSIKGCSTVC